MGMSGTVVHLLVSRSIGVVLCMSDMKTIDGGPSESVAARESERGAARQQAM